MEAKERQKEACQGQDLLNDSVVFISAAAPAPPSGIGPTVELLQIQIDIGIADSHN